MRVYLWNIFVKLEINMFLNDRGKPGRMGGYVVPAPILSIISVEVCHEGSVLPEVGEDPSPRLQGGPPSWQGFRDLQVQPTFQGAPALSAGTSRLGKTPAKAGVFVGERRTRALSTEKQPAA